jgi:hypothetical protein
MGLTSLEPYFNTIATSADGSKIATTFDYTPNGHGGYSQIEGIYISTNSGATWTQTIASNNFWSAIAFSADGNKLVAFGADLSNPPNCLVYTSTNSGITWMQAIAPALPALISVASSGDGVKLAAVGGDGYSVNFILTSTNSGTTWTQTSAPGTNWIAIASSADGTKLVAVVNNQSGSPIYLSTNSGTSWTQPQCNYRAILWLARSCIFSRWNETGCCGF